MFPGNWEEAEALVSQVLTTWRDAGNYYGLASTLYLSSMIASGQGNYEVAKARFEECLDLARKLPNDWLVAWVLLGLGDAMYALGDYHAANEALAEAGTLFNELGDALGKAYLQVSLGGEAFRTAALRRSYQTIRRRAGFGTQTRQHIVVACALAGYAGIAGEQGQLRLSAQFFGCADALLLTASTTLAQTPDDPQHGQIESQARRRRTRSLGFRLVHRRNRSIGRNSRAHKAELLTSPSLKINVLSSR